MTLQRLFALAVALTASVAACQPAPAAPSCRALAFDTAQAHADSAAGRPYVSAMRICS